MLNPTFKTRDAARQFILAGNSRFTVVSKKTGTRFTYRVRRPSDNTPWFVQVLTGSNNDSDYTFFGTIFSDARFSHSKKSVITTEAPSAKAFAWLWSQLSVDGEIPAHAEVYHEGRCGRCARALTDPESIESGYGPECIQKVRG